MVAQRDVVGVAQPVVVELVSVGRVVETGLQLVLVGGVVVRLLELGGGGLLHVVAEHPLRQLGAQLSASGSRGATTPLASVSLPTV